MKLVILDRDGVINEDSDAYIKNTGEWRPIPGSLDAIARLSRQGWRVVLATNQSGLGRKLFTISELNLIHAKLHRQLAEVGGNIEAIFFCPCLPGKNCECRKPNPGMLLNIAERLHISLENVPFIGDSLRDIETARNAGAQPWLVRTGNGTKTESELSDTQGIHVHDDLAIAVEAILEISNDINTQSLVGS